LPRRPAAEVIYLVGTLYKLAYSATHFTRVGGGLPISPSPPVRRGGCGLFILMAECYWSLKQEIKVKPVAAVIRNQTGSVKLSARWFSCLNCFLPTD